MSSTKKEEQMERKPSIHSLREQRKNRLVIIGFVITAALIVGMIGYALLYDSVIKEHIPVAKVDNKKIDNEYFKDRVRLERNSYIQQYNMLYAQYQMFAEEADYAEYFISQLGQIQSILDDYESFGENVLDSMIDDQVVAIEVGKMGIDVTDAEIDDLVQKLFNYFPNGTPTPEATATAYSTPTVSKTQIAILGNTPTPEESETIDADAAPTETPEISEAAVEETEVVDTIGTPEATAGPTEIPATSTPSATETPYTEELYQQNYSDYMTDLAAVNIREEYLRKYIYHYLLNQKFKEQIYAEVPVEQEQVWARHILVETENEAKLVLSRLDAGDNWSVIAAEVSLDTSNNTNGGDLGWFPRGYMVEAFEEAAFTLQPGEISQPVETEFGWHIIQCVGHETRPLAQSEYESAQQIYYEKWLAEKKSEKNIKINDVWKDLVPQDPTISEEYRVS